MKAFLLVTAFVVGLVGAGVGGLAASDDGAAGTARALSGTRSTSLGTSARPVGSLTAFMFHAVNAAGNSWHIEPAPADTSVRVSEQQAVAAALAEGPFRLHPKVIAAGLVTWRDTDPAHSPYVWAVFFAPNVEMLTGGRVPVSGQSGEPKPPPVDYAVTFVDGATGKVLSSGDGYTPPSSQGPSGTTG